MFVLALGAEVVGDLLFFFFGRVAGLGKNQTLKRSDGGKRRTFFF